MEGSAKDNGLSGKYWSDLESLSPRRRHTSSRSPGSSFVTSPTQTRKSSKKTVADSISPGETLETDENITLGNISLRKRHTSSRSPASPIKTSPTQSRKSSMKAAAYMISSEEVPEAKVFHSDLR